VHQRSRAVLVLYPASDVIRWAHMDFGKLLISQDAHHCDGSWYWPVRKVRGLSSPRL